MNAERIINVLQSGVWGTIGPYSLQAAALTARLTGAEYCLLTHSAGSALEAVMRALGAYHDDCVLVPASAAPIVKLCPNLTGARTFICGHAGCRLTLPDIHAAVNGHSKLKCAVLDYSSIDGLEEIQAFLRHIGMPLILWAGGSLFSKYKDKFICSLADAVVYSFSEGSDVYAGNAGALITNSKKLFDGAFAAHNCGRVLGEGATLEFNDAIGGNMRIPEWQAAIIYDALSGSRQ